MLNLSPSRPPMDPATGVRRADRRPHEMWSPATPTSDVFVIAHLGVPRVDATTWSLAIDGLVGRSASFSLADLKACPKTVVEAAHQCCGSPLEPHVPTRRIANLRWGGVDLAGLLDELGVDARARFLWSYGLDGGSFAGKACEWYVKDLPLTRLAAGDVLLAYELNGAVLSAEHGFPVRLVVPGYYGTNSVKWLWRMHLAERRADGLFASELYNDASDPEDVAAGSPPRRPVWAMAPEALIVAPAAGVVIGRDAPTEIWGWAWSFRGVATVLVSVDGGTTYSQANLEPRRGWGWQRFSLPWRPTVGGETLVSACACDASGLGQPRDGARNAIHAVPVTVR